MQEIENYFTKETAAAAFESNDIDNISKAMVAVALNEPDWQWAQQHFLNLLQHDDVGIRCLAVTCLGHIARIHGCLDKEKVLAAFKDKINDTEMAGSIDDAMADFNIFLK